MDCEQRSRGTQGRGQTRGACPGAFTPMLCGDGWLVRIRTGARALSSRELRALSRLAQEHGNGIIELTRRANLQLRGLRLERISELQAELVALGLVDASPSREARPGLLVDPVAAIDNAALNELAYAIDEALAESAASHLSAKLGVVLDAGSGSVSAVAADILVVAGAARDNVQIHVGTHAGTQLLGECERAQAASAVKKLLSMLSDFARGEPAHATTAAVSRESSNAPVEPSLAATSGRIAAARIRDLVAARGLAALRADVAALVAAPASLPLRALPPTAALGFRAAGSSSWLGIALPFGSASHAEWVEIAELAERFASAEVRLTPGRELLFVGVQREQVDRLAEVASRLGFITGPTDPRRPVVACSGAPACSSAYGDTRGLASTLGTELQLLLAAGATLHVSGCEKGCASRAPADFSVVLAPDGARLALNADVAAASCAPVEALSTISAKLRSLDKPMRTAQ